MMKKNFFLGKIVLLLLLTLIVAAVFMGCGKDVPDSTSGEDLGAAGTSAPVSEAVGEGAYSFDFKAVFADGTSKAYRVSTDAETVGKALLELNLLAGEESEFGLYVKSVCGVEADYEKDGTYWALYVDGEMSMVGVDGVKTDAVSSVEFRVEK